MSTVNKLLEIGLIARAISQNFLYRRATSKLIAVVILAIITGMLAGGLLMVGFYASYLGLVRHGINTSQALCSASVAAAMTTLLCYIATIYFLRKLRETLLPIPSGAFIDHIVKTFMSGFNPSKN